jgi:uncharacterized protein YjbI with pentapeptide repeats
VSAWNEWRQNNSSVQPDLSGADLSGANLRGADLSKANLRGADLSKANLDGANLSQSNSGAADLSGANLCGVRLGATDLSGARLVSADLTGAVFSRQHALSEGAVRLYISQALNLDDADLSGAHLSNTSFCDVDLRHVKGLEAVVHHAPSTIGIDTIYRSEGKIPELFLRGAGVPKQFITFMRSLTRDAFEFYSCFISYSSQDQDFAERLHADLRAKDLRVWFAPEDLKIGDRFQDQIEESIRLYDKVMIILSEASVRSHWVEREANAAREREERENRTVLFPIRIDDAVMDAKQPWAADLRRVRHIGNFHRWKEHDEYQKALARLLRDLKSEGSEP